MRRDEAVTRLQRIAPELRAFGVAHLYLFGSVVRDQAGPASDLDIFVDPDGTKLARLDGFMAPLSLIEDTFPGMPVGYGTRNGLSAYARHSAETEAIRIF